MLTEQNIKKIFKETTRYFFSQEIVEDSKIWDYTINLYDSEFSTISKWDDFQNTVIQEFDSFEDYRYKIRDFNTKFINHFKNAPKYDFSKIVPSENFINICKKVKGLQRNRTYLSLDISSASDYLIYKIYDKDAKSIRQECTDSKLILSSKPCRIRCNNNLITNEVWTPYLQLIENLYWSDHIIIQKLREHNCELSFILGDELVFDITNYVNDFSEYIGNQQWEDMLFHVTIFTFSDLYFIDKNNKPRRYNIRTYLDGTNNYITKNCPYFNQIYKIFNGLEINDLDLYITSDDIRKPYFIMKEPIKLISKEEYDKYYESCVL